MLFVAVRRLFVVVVFGFWFCVAADSATLGLELMPLVGADSLLVNFFFLVFVVLVIVANVEFSFGFEIILNGRALIRWLKCHQPESG